MARTNTSTGSGGLTAVEHDSSLLGDGTSGDPLGLANVLTDGITVFGDGVNTPISAKFTQSGKYMISGGASWSGTGYTYDVSALSYYFDGYYTAAPTQVTMASADPTDNRFDAIVVDQAGSVTVITGMASTNPVYPTIPDDQLVVGYVFVIAASTQPTILQDSIYLDNTEWTTSTYTTGGGSLGTIDFNSTDTPKQGTKCAKATATNGRLGMRFTRGTVIDLQTFSFVQIWARLTATVPTNKSLNVRFDNSSGTPIGSTVNLFNYGMSRSIATTWQLVVVPVAAFGAITNVKGLRAIMAGGLVGATATWSLDFMLLSGGILPQGALGPIFLSPSSTLYSSGAASGATAVTDSIFFGTNAGFQATSANNSIFLGLSAGYRATNSDNSIFLGQNAGYLADNTSNSFFLGTNAGYSAVNATNSFFVGTNAGYQANDAVQSIFLGDNTGYQAYGAYDSFFFGHQAGYQALNANNSIFIGKRSGYLDTVDNTSGTKTSILIGDDTSTGGFSNSIAIGKSATNTKTNQILFPNTIINFHLPLVSFANDAAAGVGGLVAGDWYYNTTTPAVDIKQ